MPGAHDGTDGHESPDADRPDDGRDQVPTGLGSGAVSGLGHSQTSEPEPLLEAGTGTDDDER